jgi:hypothetical protein
MGSPTVYKYPRKALPKPELSDRDKHLIEKMQREKQKPPAAVVKK